MRRLHVALVLLLLSACLPEEPVPEPEEEEVAPGWVESRPSPQAQTLMDVAVLASFRAYAVGTEGTLLRYDRGTWEKEALPAELDEDVTLWSVSGVRDDETGEERVMAAGASGAVLLRDDGGWRALQSPSEHDLFGVWMRTFDDAFVVGEAGTILRFDGEEVLAMAEEAMQVRELPDGTLEEYTISVALKGVSGTGGGNVLAVGLGGSAYRFDGSSWRREDARTSRPFSDVFMGAGTWATATDGLVFRRRGEDDWDGTSHQVPVPLYLQGVWASGGDDVHAVGMAGAIYRYDGEAWQTSQLAEEAHLRSIDGFVIEPAAEDREAVRVIFAVGAGGRVLRGPSARPGDDRRETGEAP